MNAALDHADYRAFLEAKRVIAPQAGIAIDPAAVNPVLRPHVRVVVPWALAGGRRAIFARFGLHKTTMQIEILRLLKRAIGGHMLCVLPLDVVGEFEADAERFFTGEYGVRLKFIRATEDLDPDVDIHLTNYETAREGKIDPAHLAGISLDEAAVLRGFGGTKTFREFMRLFEAVQYKFVATATPSPNEYIELLAYAAFLGVMDIGQAKTRFFKRNSEKADELTIHPHKEREFWLWVASWALFIEKPSDLGCSDEGYVLPDHIVRWHEIPNGREAGEERDGQKRLLHKGGGGLVDAAREKRDTIDVRVAHAMAIVAEAPGDHFVLWHDLEAERAAIEKALPAVRSVFGAQKPEDRRDLVRGFKAGDFAYLAAKKQMLGAGVNLQANCHRAVFVGVDHKFHDFIQAVHRLLRFGQAHAVQTDIIHTEAEREVRRDLEAKWVRHQEQVAIMSDIVREYGLTNLALGEELVRAIGVDRSEINGERYRIVRNDCVEEARALADDSVDLIVTSIPFATQYEYTPSYNDFGHTDDNDHFWAQMDFLTPQLLRALKPGRVAMIHVKDRIVPGGMTGLGFQTVEPFSDQCVAHFRKHGFAFLARKTITTDVVRENNQTYRLGWTEQCKDGSRMGAGMPEYGLVFRKPPTDRSNGYADTPVAKDMPLGREPDGTVGPWSASKKQRPVEGTGYSRGRWQLDAHGYMPSSGNRHLTPQELAALPADQIYKLWKAFSLAEVYDYEHHVAVGEHLDQHGQLPPTFMLLPPHSSHPDVWSDITRMRTLNGAQQATGREMHLCPLQFDFVERTIRQYSMEGETVLDPFGGLMTVPYCAIRMGRRGMGFELNAGYFTDGAHHLAAAERAMATPTLFDLIGLEAAE